MPLVDPVLIRYRNISDLKWEYSWLNRQGYTKKEFREHAKDYAHNSVEHYKRPFQYKILSEPPKEYYDQEIKSSQREISILKDRIKDLINRRKEAKP